MVAHRIFKLTGVQANALKGGYSIPFFYSGNPDHQVRCLPGCLAEGERPKYPPVTVEEHLMEMYRRTYA